MAKHDWKALQAEFLEEHRESGITAQEWCSQRGINYQSARRYIKVRKAETAQSAQSATAQSRKTAQSAQNRTAQSGKSAQSRSKAGRGRSGRGDEEGELLHNSSPPESGGQDRPEPKSETSSTKSGRNAKGHFIAGNTISVGAPGNPNPQNQFTRGNQVARKHGGYAKYLTAENADDLFADASVMELKDELEFTRARSLVLTESLTRIYRDMANGQDVVTRAELYGLYLKAEQALERNIARIESLHRTISGIEINNVQVERYTEDVERIRQAKRKLRAEADVLEQNAGKSDTPTSDIVNDIRSRGSGGLMS